MLCGVIATKVRNWVWFKTFQFDNLAAICFIKKEKTVKEKHLKVTKATLQEDSKVIWGTPAYFQFKEHIYLLPWL